MQGGQIQPACSAICARKAAIKGGGEGGASAQAVHKKQLMGPHLGRGRLRGGWRGWCALFPNGRCLAHVTSWLRAPAADLCDTVEVVRMASSYWEALQRTACCSGVCLGMTVDDLQLEALANDLADEHTLSEGWPTLLRGW